MVLPYVIYVWDKSVGSQGGLSAAAGKSERSYMVSLRVKCVSGERKGAQSGASEEASVYDITARGTRSPTSTLSRGTLSITGGLCCNMSAMDVHVRA